MEAAPIRLNTPGTVEEIFNHYKGRRSGLLRALTYEVEDFYQSCDPDKENLSLYGFSNGTWEVSSPMEEIPPELPEPALGINFARDGMQRKDWLSLVAAHSDAWILAVAFFFGARLNKAERKQLFNLIIDLPTLFDIVTGQTPSTEKGSSANMTSKVKAEPDRTAQPHPPPEEAADNSNDYEEDDDEGDEPNETACGMCGRRYTADEFWICCDICERWFHGKCVKVTPAKAELLKQYKCPSCSKRART